MPRRTGQRAANLHPEKRRRDPARRPGSRPGARPPDSEGVEVEQCAAIRVPGIVEEGADRRDFRDGASIENHHPIRHFRDHAKVMRDEDHGKVGSVAETAQELENLRLDRHIECRSRLIGDQQPRFGRQGDGNDDTLAHSPGQLMRIGVVANFRRCDFDLGKRSIARSRASLPFMPRRLVKTSLICWHDRHHGVERGHRLLENHRHVPAAMSPPSLG